MRSPRYQTRHTKEILSFLLQNPERAVTAEEIAAHLFRLGQTVSRSTVYRCLDRLVADRILLCFPAEDGRGLCYRYVGEENSCHSHLHLRCTACGRVMHLDCEAMNTFLSHIAHEHQFELQCERTVLYGTCKHCKKG